MIAPPSVLTSAVHGYSAADVYLLKIVPDAFTNAIPDLVLVLVGANDIGRGRNPFTVATNDMPNLLSVIFSNAPSANVIIAKITSLQGANLTGLNYAAYYTNVSIYNAALQAMVNQHRAQGQNVSLADMFSVVDINTMFNPDHVHPNAMGLQAMAQEWLTRIQAITVTANPVTSPLIHGGEVWKYSDTGQDLGTNWSQPNYDDSGWASGAARLGYGDPAVYTTVSYGPDPNNRYITTYYRHWFAVPNTMAFTNLNFRLARSDGAVVYLNGQEAFRTNMPAGPISYTNLATRLTAGEQAYIFYPTNLDPSSLVAGTNLVAVELHLHIGTRLASGMDMELLGMGNLLPPPYLTIGILNGNALLSWPSSNGTGFSLYSNTNLAATGNWILSGASLQTNGGLITATQAVDSSARFFQLQRP